VAPDGSRLPPLYTTEGGASLGEDPLLDYLFLNLEGNYDTEAVAAIAEGIGQSDKAEGPSLLVRIPPIERDGAEAARARVIESLQLGADGIVIPHVRSAEEARLAVSFFTDAGVSVWSPDNPDGEKLAMIMIEDAGALAAAAEIADTPGYSVLACGIGSLSRDLGSREAGESGTQEVLQQSARVGLPNMITANAQDVEQRLEEGFLGLLMSGPSAGEAIRIGRLAVGR
jgi:2-keto-3-deoxy-L-rhamnonate aldolase RhmA